MPPEVTQYCNSIATPRTPLLPRGSPEPRLDRTLHQKRVGREMKLTKKKIIPSLVFILCCASLFRFLNVSMIANFSVSLPSAALPSIYHHGCSSPSSLCRKNLSLSLPLTHSHSPSTDSTSLTEKETLFIMEIFSKRVPCNILVFGNAHQYSRIASLNSGGATVFLEDRLDSAKTSNPTNNTRVHKIVYNTTASEAYQLLRDARGNPDCLTKLLKTSKCNLALSNMPQELHDTTWDVVVVDGPGGGGPDSPGRMASIYTAGVLARRGRNMTEVVIHDVDRMIEKWFSWEFLCEENLVSSKGRFWHFQIVEAINATTFCTP